MPAAPFVLTNAYVALGGTDVSTWVDTVEVNDTMETPDVTAMGAAGRAYVAGLRNITLRLNLWQDFAGSGIHSVLINNFTGGSLVSVAVAGRGSSFSATNPVGRGSAIITEYPVVAGKVGDAAQASVTLQVSGTMSWGTA